MYQFYLRLELTNNRLAKWVLCLLGIGCEKSAEEGTVVQTVVCNWWQTSMRRHTDDMKHLLL